MHLGRIFSDDLIIRARHFACDLYTALYGKADAGDTAAYNADLRIKRDAYKHFSFQSAFYGFGWLFIIALPACVTVIAEA